MSVCTRKSASLAEPALSMGHGHGLLAMTFYLQLRSANANSCFLECVEAGCGET